MELASPGARLGSHIIDMLIFIVPILGLAVAVILSDRSGGSGGVDIFAALVAVVGYLMPPIYTISFIAVKGQTLGKMAMKVQVVRDDNGNVPGWGKAIIRLLVPAVMSLTLCLGIVCYLAILWDKRRQGWHDKIAGTVAVKAQKAHEHTEHYQQPYA